MLLLPTIKISINCIDTLCIFDPDAIDELSFSYQHATLLLPMCCQSTGTPRCVLPVCNRHGMNGLPVCPDIAKMLSINYHNSINVLQVNY